MQPKKFLLESDYDGILFKYRQHADSIMLGMLVFLLCVCLAIAPLRNTWSAVAVIALPTLFLASLLYRWYPGSLVTRLFMACAFMAFSGLIIHQTGGSIEGHFSAFGLIGILLYYRDWRTIFAATAFIYLHHLILGYAQTLGGSVLVFGDVDFWSTFTVHILYFLPFVCMMGYLSIWLRREAYEAQRVIQFAEAICQGSPLEIRASTSPDQPPLINAVIMLKNCLLDLLRIMPVPAAIIRLEDNHIVKVNHAWEQVLGPVEHDLEADIGSHWVWTAPDAWVQLVSQLDAADGLLEKVELELQRKSGERIKAEVTIILHEEIKPVMAILTVEDVTQRRRAEQAMLLKAHTDSLTGLPNRAQIDRSLEQAMQLWHDQREPFAVIMLDLDGFKPINDEHGHDVGDGLLKIVAARLRAANRHADLIGRLGGDEFVAVIFNCTDTDLARQLAERMVRSLCQPARLANKPLPLNIGASAGVAHIFQGAGSGEELMRQADQALYAAKAGGKNQVAYFQPVDEKQLTSND